MNKKNKDTLFWGLGRWTRSNSEICLLATRGKPKRVSAAVHSVIMEPIGKHSEKPVETHKRIEKLLGDNVSKIELFGRRPVDGWTVIGDGIDGKDIRVVLKEMVDASE